MGSYGGIVPMGGEQFFRSLVESTCDIIALVDAEARFVYVSPSIARMVGAQAADLVGARLFDRVHADDAVAARGALDLVIDGSRHEASFVYRTRHDDGTWRTIEAVARAAPAHLGRRSVVLSARDVTARKLAADRLAAQLALSRVLANAATFAEAAPELARALVEHLDWDLGGLWTVDAKGESLECVAVWHAGGEDLEPFAKESRARRFGRGEDLLGRIWNTGAPGWIDDVGTGTAFARADAASCCGLHAAFAFPIAVGAEVVGVIELFSRQLRRSDAELTEMMAAVGSQIGQFFDRRRSEAQRDRALAELKALLRALPDLFFRLDEDVRFIDYSAGTESDLYAPPELFLGKRIDEVIPRDIALAMQSAIEQTHRTSGIVTLEYELPVGGANKHFELRCVPFLDRQTIAIVRNITDRHRVAEAIRESEQRLRESQKMEAVGRLAGGIAHDFNNLLMAILGYAVLVSERLREAHPAHAYVAEIRRAGERAAALTKQLLAFSRRQVLLPRVIEVGAVIRDMHDMLARVIGEDVRISMSIGEPAGNVRADPSQLEQVLLNLAINARDAMPLGGRLTIRVERVDVTLADSDRLGNVRPGAYVVLIVSDTGQGMDPETQSHMFEPFFTTKPVGVGTGLGLSTVYGIVQQSNGHIQVESAPGRGATFSVYLPRVDEPADDVPTTLRRRTPRGTETILVVEDEPAVRSLVVEVLRRLGYSVLAAETAADAFDALRKHEGAVDLLLTDLVMPGGSGAELATKVLVVRPRCRVMYISGYAGLVGTADGHDVLQKPFSPDTLAQRVRELLDAPRS